MSRPISRRAFLRRGLGLAAGALAASVPLAGCRPSGYPQPAFAPALFSPKELAVLAAAADRIVPGGPGRLAARDVGLAQAADGLFAKANPRLQGELRQLLNGIEDMTWLSGHFAPFTALAPEAQDAYLLAWQRSWLGMQRQGATGLVKLVSTLFYMDPRSWEAIGYPGPWIGRFDFGMGLDNQGPLAASPNPHVFERFEA